MTTMKLRAAIITDRGPWAPVLLVTCSAIALVRCSTMTTPRELIEARLSYRKASLGPAAEAARDELEAARRALVGAEQAFMSDPKAKETADLAYVAERLARVAEFEAQTAIDRADRALAEKELERAKEELADAREHAAERETAAREEALLRRDLEQEHKEQARIERERERQERYELDRRAEVLRELLGNIGSVHDESRGLVIIIPSGELFDNGCKLDKRSEARLDALVDAVRMQSNAHVTVESYTDSRGEDSRNRRTSELRAQAVREYLIRRGIAPERIDARGLGPDNPVDDNSTAAGRANNRRIEIILARPSA
jgi:outer membrane protein OmpA-like peptidoglycan-associated protein